MKRFSVSVSDQQYADLLEVATLDQSSISNVVRDCVRAVLPQLLDVTRFIHEPTRAPAEVLAFAEQMERALTMVSGSVVASEAASADPPRRKYSRQKPPASNTGANSGHGG